MRRRHQSNLELLPPAKRPGYCTVGNPITLASNFFSFQPYANNTILKLALFFEPDLPSQLSRQRERIVMVARHDIEARIGPFVLANTALFAMEDAQRRVEEEFAVKSQYEEIEYIVTIRPVGRVQSALESKHFFNKFFNQIQGKLNLVKVGRKFFSEKKKYDLQQHRISIWPGYVTSVSNYEAGCFVNIDICHRVLRTISVWEQMRKLYQQDSSNFQQACSKLLIGSTVMTEYNRKTYHVDNIDWTKSPLSKFFDHEGTEMTFKEYYQQR